MFGRYFNLRFVPLAAIMFSCTLAIRVPAWAQFETRTTTALPGASFAVAVGDFNRDGKLDLAVTGDALQIFLGNGDGTFQAPVGYPGVFYGIAVADFNNDGIPDIVVTDDGDSVTVFLGNGDGTFQSPKTSSISAFSLFVVTGDFNGDHKMDIAIVDTPYISILLGNGDGTFQAPSDNASFVGSQEIAVGDFNNDHRLDVAVVGYFGGSTNFGILLGNGDGTLQDSITSPLQYSPGSVSAADLNHDGNMDIAVGYLFEGGVAVFLGDGKGGFGPEEDYFGGGNASLVADFNGDGNLDIVAGALTVGASAFLGNGDGTFRPLEFFRSVGVGWPTLVGDLNGDGRPDVMIYERGATTVTSMLNTGALHFSPSTPLSFEAQFVGTASAPQTVKLTNSGNTAVSIRSMKASGPFHMRNNCGGSIAAGAHCAISVVFQPQSVGDQSGVVTIVDSASSKPQFVDLSGSGTLISVTPVSLNFGNQKVGTKSSPQTVTATNKGSAPITFSSVSIGGDNSRSFSETNNCTGHSIPPQGNCTVSVVFAPIKAGAKSASLSINANGTTGPAPVGLTGTGD